MGYFQSSLAKACSGTPYTGCSFAPICSRNHLEKAHPGKAVPERSGAKVLRLAADSDFISHGLFRVSSSGFYRRFMEDHSRTGPSVDFSGLVPDVYCPYSQVHKNLNFLILRGQAVTNRGTLSYTLCTDRIPRIIHEIEPCFPHYGPGDRDAEY